MASATARVGGACGAGGAQTRCRRVGVGGQAGRRRVAGGWGWGTGERHGLVAEAVPNGHHHQPGSPRRCRHPSCRCKETCRGRCSAAAPQVAWRAALWWRRQRVVSPPSAAAAPAQSPACAASGWAGGGQWPARGRQVATPPSRTVHERRWRRRGRRVAHRSLARCWLIGRRIRPQGL